MIFAKRLLNEKLTSLRDKGQTQQRLIVLKNIALDTKFSSALLYLKTPGAQEFIMVAELSRGPNGRTFTSLDFTIDSLCQLKAVGGDIHVCGNYIDFPPNKNQTTTNSEQRISQKMNSKTQQVDSENESASKSPLQSVAPKPQASTPLRRSTRTRIPVSTQANPKDRTLKSDSSSTSTSKPQPIFIESVSKKDQKYLKVQEKQSKKDPSDWRSLLSTSLQESDSEDEEDDEEFSAQDESQSSDDSSSQSDDEANSKLDKKCESPSVEPNPTKKSINNIQIAEQEEDQEQRVTITPITSNPLDVLKFVENYKKEEMVKNKRFETEQSKKIIAQAHQFFNRPQNVAIDKRRKPLFDQIKAPTKPPQAYSIN